MTEQETLAQYLAALRLQMRFVTLGEREEIVREIEAHVRDAVREGMPMETVLARLGSPAELSEQYRDGVLIRKAGQSRSPWLLLRAALRLATRGGLGVVVLVLALFGYSLGGGLALTSVGKLLFPANTGAWFQGGQLVSSGMHFPIPAAPAHEVLGWWYVPVAAIVGGVVLALTSLLVRRYLRASRSGQMRWAASV